MAGGLGRKGPGAGPPGGLEHRAYSPAAGGMAAERVEASLFDPIRRTRTRIRLVPRCWVGGCPPPYEAREGQRRDPCAARTPSISHLECFPLLPSLSCVPTPQAAVRSNTLSLSFIRLVRWGGFPRLDSRSTIRPDSKVTENGSGMRRSGGAREAGSPRRRLFRRTFGKTQSHTPGRMFGLPSPAIPRERSRESMPILAKPPCPGGGRRPYGAASRKEARTSRAAPPPGGPNERGDRLLQTWRCWIPEIEPGNRAPKPVPDQVRSAG